MHSDRDRPVPDRAAHDVPRALSPRRGMGGRWGVLATLSLLVVGCGDPREEQPPPAAMDVDPTERQYAPELGIDFDEMERLPSGLYYRDDPPGDGPEAEPGRAVTVHYTGYFPDGRVFDSSRDRGEPYGVMVGAGQVIPGWDQGIPGMRVGGHRTLVIPPHLAYGAQGSGGVIPPNAVLVFEVELLAVN